MLAGAASAVQPHGAVLGIRCHRDRAAVAMQHGAVREAARRHEELERGATARLIAQAERALNAGADIIMIESEGITENVTTWRTDVVARIINQLGLDKVMFEGADPPVFEWYIKNYGNEMNLFVDHSQIVQLEALRSGIWGTKSTWGRIQNLGG